MGYSMGLEDVYLIKCDRAKDSPTQSMLLGIHPMTTQASSLLADKPVPKQQSPLFKPYLQKLSGFGLSQSPPQNSLTPKNLFSTLLSSTSKIPAKRYLG